MANLNQIALKDPTVYAGKRGPSFWEVLLDITDEIVRLATGHPIHYIKLGPEP